MTTPDPITRADAALDAALERLRADRRASDPHALRSAGRLHTRLEAIRALSAKEPVIATVLAKQLIETIALDLRDDASPEAFYAAAGAALLGAA